MSTNERKFIEKTLKSYQEKEVTKIDELKALDKKAKTGPRVFAYIFGSIGSLILGTGMTMAMELIPGGMLIGILIGIAGLLITGFNYPLYKVILKSSKAKYADKITALSQELLKD